MKTKEKIAMIWVIPFMTVLMIGLFLVLLCFYFVYRVLEFTGTIGAIDKVLSAARLRGMYMELKKLQKQDEKTNTFDLNKYKRNENTSSTTD